MVVVIIKPLNHLSVSGKCKSWSSVTRVFHSTKSYRGPCRHLCSVWLTLTHQRPHPVVSPLAYLKGPESAACRRASITGRSESRLSTVHSEGPLVDLLCLRAKGLGAFRSRRSWFDVGVAPFSSLFRFRAFLPSALLPTLCHSRMRLIRFHGRASLDFK